MESVIDAATVRFQCRERLYGSWVSVNKSEIVLNNEYLQLMEVRVFEGKLWYRVDGLLQGCNNSTANAMEYCSPVLCH